MYVYKVKTLARTTFCNTSQAPARIFTKIISFCLTSCTEHGNFFCQVLLQLQLPSSLLYASASDHPFFQSLAKPCYLKTQESNTFSRQQSSAAMEQQRDLSSAVAVFHPKLRCLLSLNHLPILYKIESTVETVEQIVNAVEKVAEQVDKVTEDITDDLPEGKLKQLLDFVEDMAEKTADTADSIGDIIDKVQEAGEKVEAIVDSLDGEEEQTPKVADIQKQTV
ncbi:hypothetical protein Sango_2175300 [Sesamum angolense]|uniref:Uncharacterized protein n=1 Tax=Sesamum angolense TaxID=2727404 RepID=A0AAE1WD43_9LAMI|nr:hypothetical protein Sango_2175300 [Sesamum angolense]